jgi:hypothetical protein
MNNQSPLGGDKLKRAVIHFSELVELSPEKSRAELLQIVQLKFDLSPAECDFLDRRLKEDS